jgi:hypothetical protein
VERLGIGIASVNVCIDCSNQVERFFARSTEQQIKTRGPSLPMPWSSIGVLSRINVAKCSVDRQGFIPHVLLPKGNGSDITRAKGDDQLGRPRVYLGFPLEVLGKPAATRLNHCP